jgi:pre-mRNA-splicing factor 18
MDALKAVIANKRKTIEDEAASPRNSKYVRRGEMERLREEEEGRQRQAKATKVNDEEPNTKTAKVEGEAITCVCVYF